MRRLPVIALFAGLALLAACGSDSNDSSTAAPTTAASGSSPASTAESSGASASTIKVSETSLGEVLVDGDGMTLYLFTPDTGTDSTCYDACAAAWPVLKGPGSAGEGVEADDLGTTTRKDGSVQVTYYGHPLYHYAGDGAPGDVSGQDVGGKWYVVDAEGNAVKSAAGASSSPSTTKAATSGY